VARAIHEESKRGPFIAVPCGAIPRDLAESELFGHEKGAFTGAVQRRLGRFEMAHNGTLLLDDVDDLPLEIQPKLLRVLQEGDFERVGGEGSVSVDVRVLTASKKNLLDLVEAGLFREDLYYRLNVMTVSLPPLHERKGDIFLLAQYFLERLSAREGDRPKTLSDKAARMLLNYHWPGNVRELQAAIESADAVTKGEEILPNHLPPALTASTSTLKKPFTLNLDDVDGITLKEITDDFEKEVIHWALMKAHGHQQKAAKLLRIPRTTLQSKLLKYPDDN
jgi:DNA-binding NtrC family response regulator